MKNITDIIQFIHILFSIIEKGLNIAKELFKKRKEKKAAHETETSKKQPSDREA